MIVLCIKIFFTIIMGPLVSVCIMNFAIRRVKPVTVMLTANPFAQREKEIHLNCSSDVVPFGQTAEFLVNNMTYTNIRKHKWVCFNTKLNKTCSSRSCSCAGDRKSYTLTLKPMKNVNQVTFLCRMKFTGGTVKSSTELVVTILDISSPKIHLDQNLPLISGNFVNLTCSSTKINSMVYFVWKCGHVTYQKDTMNNETFVWSTLKLKIDSTYNGIQCICNLHSRKFDISVSDFVNLNVTKTPILTLNSEFYCNSSSTVALVCSVMGELGMFGFAQWIHTFDGKYIRSLHGTTNRYISILIINDCSFEDGGQYTCAVWNKNGDKLLWANQTTTLKFVGSPIILSKTVKDNNVGQQIIVTFYTSSSLVSVNWQCDGVVTNNSLLKPIRTDFEVYKKNISLLAYETYILTENNQCFKENNVVCLSNIYSEHCEKILFTEHAKGKNGFNVLWIMFAVVCCVIAIGIALSLVGVVKHQLKNASQSIQLEEIDNATNEGLYLQINEPDQRANHQNDAALSPNIEPETYQSTRSDEIAQQSYIEPVSHHPIRGDRTVPRSNIISVPQHSTRGDETVGRPYNDLEPYQSSSGYDVASPEYLDVQPDTDSNSSQSDQYEKIE